MTESKKKPKSKHTGFVNNDTVEFYRYSRDDFSPKINYDDRVSV